MSAPPLGRGPDSDVLEMLSQFCFVPLTIGGGIRTVDEVRCAIKSGADKVSVNTHALKRPDLITEIADVFGGQCVVVSMGLPSRT